MDALDGGLQSGGRHQTHGLGGLDLHGFASLWVTAGASSALGNLESAEADELHIAIFLDAFGDGLKDGFESVASSAL